VMMAMGRILMGRRSFLVMRSRSLLGLYSSLGRQRYMSLRKDIEVALLDDMYIISYNFCVAGWVVLMFVSRACMPFFVLTA
jgi:hypothetical protein